MELISTDPFIFYLLLFFPLPNPSNPSLIEKNIVHNSSVNSSLKFKFLNYFTAISYSWLTGNCTRFSMIKILVILPAQGNAFHFSSVLRKRWHSLEEEGVGRTAVPWWVNIHYPVGTAKGEGPDDLTVSKGREIDPGDLCPPRRRKKSNVDTRDW